MTTELATIEKTGLAILNETAIALDPNSPEFREQVESGAVELARVFRETTSAMRSQWAAFQAACGLLEETMKDPTASYRSYHFKVSLYYDGREQADYRDRMAIDSIIRAMNVRVWEILINRMGIKNLMSVKRREEFEKQIQNGDVPEVTEANILSVIMGLASQAADFATEAAKETLKLLTPSNAHYKTNSGFKVGRRVILSWYVEGSFSRGRFRANYRREKELIAIDGTFHVLDGKGPIRGHTCPLIEAITKAEGGKGETEYFKFRCFKNCNLHLEFKRLDLVKKLNGLATGEYVLGADID